MKNPGCFLLLGVLLSYCLLPAGKGLASIVIDTERKLMIYSNDGDGMQYVLSGDVKKSVRYGEEIKYPLGADGKLRFILDGERQIKGVFAKPGRAGLTNSRPISDMEVAQANEGLLKLSQSLGASTLALDPKADLGPVVDSFDVLRGKEQCKIMFHEKAVDVCGERFGRQGVVNWTMFNDRVCTYWCIGSFRVNIGYQSLEGRKAVAFEFINNEAAQRFVQVFSSWSGSLPQRI